VHPTGSQCTLHYILGNWDASEQLAATFDVAVTTPAQARLSVLALPVEIGRGHKRAGERLKWIRMLGQDLLLLPITFVLVFVLLFGRRSPATGTPI
jgi:hypothetical protein